MDSIINTLTTYIQILIFIFDKYKNMSGITHVLYIVLTLFQTSIANCFIHRFVYIQLNKLFMYNKIAG